MTDLRTMHPHWSDLLDRALTHVTITDKNYEAFYNRELAERLDRRKAARTALQVCLPAFFIGLGALIWSLLGTAPIEVAGYQIKPEFACAPAVLVLFLTCIAIWGADLIGESLPSQEELQASAKAKLAARQPSAHQLSEIAKACTFSPELAEIVQSWREQLGGEITHREAGLLWNAYALAREADEQRAASAELDEALATARAPSNTPR